MRACLMTTVIILSAVTTAAAAEFRAEGSTRIAYIGPILQTSYDVSDDLGAGDGTVFKRPSGEILASASSLADIGGLRANAYASIREVAPLQANEQHAGIASATATFEVVVTGPPGPVTTSFRMHLSGQVAATSTRSPLNANGASSGVGISFRVNGVLLPGGPFQPSSGSIGFASEAGGPMLITGELGVLNGWRPPGGDIVSPAFTVQAGVPFTLQILLGAGVNTHAGTGETALITEGNADFGSTLRFVTNGPVFDLPAGYTVDAPDAGITDNRLPCTTGCTLPGSTCDAGKIGCVAQRQACLLKVHATAEKTGAAPDAAALAKCGAVAGVCIGKLESKQNPAKPKTICSASDQSAALAARGDTFATGVVSAIDPGFPTVGPASVCDAAKKLCVRQRAACLLKAEAAARKKAATVDPAKVQACVDQFDGGAKGFAKGCLGKLEAKQNAEKPKTLCTVTGDATTLEQLVDTFVTDTVGTILGAP